MKRLYKTLGLQPTATENEIRSAYRRCALSSHPDKGGSAEAFRSVVHAFETLIDVSRRASHGQLQGCRGKSAAGESVKQEVCPPKKRLAESSEPAKDEPKQASAKEVTATERALKQPKPRKRQALPVPVPQVHVDCDPVGHADLFCLLLRLPKKQALEELEKLTEEALNALAKFLESEEAEEILLKLSVSRQCKPRMLALKDGPKTRKLPACSQKATSDDGTHKEVSKAPKETGRGGCVNTGTARAPRVPTPRLIGLYFHQQWGRYQPQVLLFTNFAMRGQTVKNLDVAIDMHISLVQIRQHVAAGLAVGKDFRKVVQDAIQTEQKERAAAGAVKLCLRFCSHVWVKKACTQRTTATTYDLDTALQDWMTFTGQKVPSQQVGINTQCREEIARKHAVGEQQRVSRLEWLRQKAKKEEAQSTARQRGRERREARLLSKQKRQVRLQQKNLPLARIKYRRLKAMVLTLQARFQKIRTQKLLGTWGVLVLPEGLQVSSFQSADDSLCATLRLSDGTEVVGPYRKNFQQALQELQELRALQQRRGNQALQKEMQRRDVEAMTAFFVESIS
eukprot:s1602_g4.t1